MQACQNGLERIKNCNSDLQHYIDNCGDTNMTEDEKAQLSELDKFRVQFETAMDDDFNTADAVSSIYELVRFINKNLKENVSKEFAEKEMEMLGKLCGVLGINKEKEKADDGDTALIEELIAKRADAKKNKNFAEADAIRDKLSEMGVTIKDTRQGTQWFRS